MAPPTLATLAEELRRQARELTQILDVLARRGDVVRVDKDLWFTRTAVEDARRLLLEQLGAGGEVTLAGFRDAAGCGRRNAQALLELFDREGLTLRRGDVRVARRRRS
jgi:selenocysteine-specific elongation factor